MRNSQKAIFLFLIFLLPTFSFSQKTEGIPFIRNYSPKEFKASTDNWAIAEDKLGVMYFGNASGVLTYDGINWRQISVTNNSIVRSLAIDSTGIVYVGAVGEFGFLSPNEKGVLTYHSLLSKLNLEERDFADVWKTYVTADGIYFQTFTKLIRLSKNSIKIWKPTTSFHFSFFVNNELYINERGKGLEHIVNDKLELIKNGDFFSGLRIYSMLPFSKNKILIATREKGFVLMDTRTNIEKLSFQFWNVEANADVINSQIYGGVSLDNNRFAFATLQNGVFIMDTLGDNILTLHKQNGLRDDIVNFVFKDLHHDLWIALGTGITRVETSSPLRFFYDSQGLNGSVQDIIKNNNNLYVATSQGTYKEAGNHFIPIDGINFQTWSLLKFITPKDTLLLASTEDGLYEIKNSRGLLLEEGFGYFIYQSKINTERLFIGRSDGLSSLRYEKEHWIHEGYFAGVDKEIRSIAEDDKGNLWLGTPFDGLIKIDFNNPKNQTDSLITSWGSGYSVHYYDTTSGLPDMKYNIPYLFKNKIIFATYKGIYEFNEGTSHFTISPLLKKDLGQNQIYRFAPKDSLTIWMFTVSLSGKKETGIAYLKDGSYSWYTKPFGKISESEIHAIFPDDHDITWLGGPDGLLRYDGNVKKDFSQPFNTLIRNVTIGKDSLIFGGTFYETKDSINLPSLIQTDQLKPTIGYDYNSIRFEYTAASYGDEQNNLFNVYLEGNDNDWSGWSLKNLKEYTNLHEGTYIFHVKSKNIYGTESSETTYSFTILPPWYRTVWAYVLYVIAFILLVYFVVQLSVRRLKQAKIQLEATVKERTAEVVKQKEEIEVQKQIVEHKNKDITDSINYAQRIQRALLASDQLLKKNLPEHFVFFQPKDIVSGDFYWASELSNGQFALVTADSTGHGVPGAIMSMLNISCLNEAINGEKLTAPGKILNYTRKKIIDHLANDGSAEGGKDGMDCSLVSFDFKNNQLTYSAANNPVWIVRKGELIDLAPDKMPVGKHDKDTVPFSQQTIELQRGDVVYTLTDGMPDQFGGPKARLIGPAKPGSFGQGKKFMYKQLKELLISISSKPANEQLKTLHTAINDWKGDLEQVDDICLIGVKI